MDNNENFFSVSMKYEGRAGAVHTTGLFERCVGGAVFSEDRVRRHLLWRSWRKEGQSICWIMLNPSSADGDLDDPTVGQVTYFSRRAGFGEMVIVNLTDFRCVCPDDLPWQDGLNAYNRKVVSDRVSRSTTVVAAWGSHRVARHLAPLMLKALLEDRVIGVRRPLHCLGLTKSGFPRHPLYVRRDTKLERYHYERTGT